MQFAEKDTSSTFPIMIKTSFEKNGRLIELVMFPKSIDPNSSGMQTYLKFLSSFKFD